MDATMLVAQKNGMYKNVEMCQDCLRKWLNTTLKWYKISLFLRNEINFVYNVHQKQLFLGKTQKIEEFCLRKLFNSDFFWS